MAEGPLLLAISQLRTTGKYSDLTLVCQQQEFRVHNATVCSQSTFLAAACDGDFEASLYTWFLVSDYNNSGLLEDI